MAYPPSGCRWLVFVGIAGLLIALKDQRGTRARAIGFLFGMAAFSIGVSWLYQVFGPVVVVLWMVLAAFPALFAQFQSLAAVQGVSDWQWAIFTTLNWSAWEFVGAELFPLKFPWMSAGLAIGPNALLPWIGAYGVGTIVVLAVALIMAGRWKTSIGVLVALAVSVLLFKWELGKSDGALVKVAGLQWETVTLDTFLTETRKLPDNVRYVVWPEYAVPFDIRQNPRDMDLILNLCREKNITLTFGTQRRSGGDGKWENTALTVDGSGILGEHTKNHTVHFFDDGMPGKTAVPVRTPHGKVGTPICFDCDYEDVVRRMTKSGGEFIVAPTMDAEKWTVRQHDQHAELFQIRAAENGRWVFVTATSGVSQMIDPRGKVHSRLGAMKQGVISDTLRRESELTFYTKFGWVAPWVTLVMAVLSWGLVIFRRQPAAR